MASSYWFVAHPKNVEHQHPYLVFDSQDRLHLPLTRFAKEVRSRLDPKTIPAYLYALCPYFTWLDTNTWQVRMGQTWDASPTQVRRSIDDYLTQKLQCQNSSTAAGLEVCKDHHWNKEYLADFSRSVEAVLPGDARAGDVSFCEPAR